MTDTQKRLHAVRDSLGDLEVDALLVTDETNVHYLSGFTGDSSYLLVTENQTTILSDGRFETQIAIDCGQIACEIRPPSQLLSELAQSILNDCGAKRVAIESDHLSLAVFREIESGCDSIELVETSGIVESNRMVKDEIEINRTRRAVEIAQQALEAVLSSLGADDTERQVAYRIEAEMRDRGAEGCSFPPIVAGGAAAAIPHYHPSQKTIGEAATLLIDWGANFQGYASDLTRTFHLGKASDRFERAYEAVLQAQLAAIDLISPGVMAADVDRVARDVLDQAGFGDAFVHSLGHGTGLEIHEGPKLSATSEQTLLAGMIVTVEPGLYFKGEFGIRIEDDILVTESGCEVLSQFPKGLDDCRLML